MGANERKNVMYVRKKRKKWQCLVRLKGVTVSQSFWSKTDARLWGQKTEVDISNGVYLKNLKLVEMRLKDLLQLYLEKALHKSKRPKILKYNVEMLRRTPLARYTLVQLSPVKIAEFRDDRLKVGKSYYELGTKEEEKEEITYTWDEPKVKDPGADYKPGRFKHLDEAIRNTRKK